MEQINEQETLQTPEEETPLEELALPAVVEDDVKAELERVKETNAKLFARAKKAEEKLKAGKPIAPESNPVKSQEDPIESVLKLRSEGFNDAEILELRNKARQMGVSVPTLLADDTFKAGIEAKRHKAQIEQATPEPSASVGRVINGKSWAEMSNEERKANFDKMMNG